MGIPGKERRRDVRKYLKMYDYIFWLTEYTL